ncbi:TetR/AcrR family transcriptional regulator [Actinomarinicola tropica]|uniref:TetR family transcriptional regulator n=1 Tax=Actinomarinicola tropica TaxID=2789776 RepID=A0A5Q2RIC7_9ACTN|nr:TetR/AcrR family transcriptional regulator C-terminal domain-containing protein [Actinomarinicola tropica]QGG93747.1 TetR family transcriptional regulator [Actinomarinicola tropica]
MTNAATTPPPDNRRGGLTRDDIVTAALELVRTEGIQAVTMRRLADVIGVTPMALYHHVPNKGVLLDLVVERVGADLRLAHDGRPWTDQIRDYAHAWRVELHRYPGVAGHLLRQAAPPAMSWRIMDDAISLMVEAGYDEQEATRAFAGLVSFVLARCDQEEVMAGHAHADEVEITDDRIRGMLPAAHDNLDLGRVARYLTELSHDEHFAYMLDRILAGIDVQRG